MRQRSKLGLSHHEFTSSAQTAGFHRRRRLKSSAALISHFFTYRQRNISAGNPGIGNSVFLRARYCDRRQHFAPAVGWLIESGSAWRVSFGYVLAALLLLIAAVTELKFGIDAEGKSLESIADPVSSRRSR
jgi:hypothetical protein